MNLSTVINGIRRNWRDRHWYPQAFNMVVPTYYYREIADNDGEYFLERDWDTLHILDGCRLDLFEEVYAEYDDPRLDGDLGSVRSRGSASTEFIAENFAGKEFDDVVYVTANPFVYDLAENPFHHVDHVWLNDWDEDLETVHPRTMVEHARDAHERFPEKRLIVHFMQPHYPFIGDFRLEEDPGFTDAIAKSLDEETEDRMLVWERLRRGKVSDDEVWRAFSDNLELVLDHTADLVESIDGKHVLTADHGNAMGERASPFPTRVYGHDDYLHIPSLVDVPWLELPAETRRTITHGESEAGTAGDADGSPTASDLTDADEDSVEDRLAALGYR